MLFGVLCVGLVELALRLTNVGADVPTVDPFVSFQAVQPLFVPQGASGMMITSPDRWRCFQEESFQRRKSDGAFRVFCFGGSTVQGNPHGRETAFSTFLRLALETADPTRRWEVINCGGLSYASYRVANLVGECLAYEPDLFVLCTGHNEFLEDRTYGHLKRSPAWVSHTLQAASHLRLFNLMRQASEALRRDRRPVLREEVDALLDYEGGLKAYHYDPEWREGVIAHFEHNVERMIQLSAHDGVPLILVSPVSNLRDSPPFKSEHPPGQDAAALQQWTNLVARAQEAVSASRLEAAADALKQATATDPGYASTWFRLGTVELSLGRTNEARAAFLQARDTDVCPLRILSPMETTIAHLVRQHDVPLIDWQAMIAARSEHGIPGNDWLLDHVHPSPKGHMLLASALAKVMEARGWVRLGSDWQERSQARWQEHLRSLPEDYYEQGETALAGLRAWTQGRASGPPIEYHLLNRAKADGPNGP